MPEQIQQQQIKRRKPSALYSIIIVSLVLFLLGLFALILVHAKKVVTFFKEKVEVFVEIKNDTPDAEIFKLRVALEKQDFIKKGSLQFISKEDGAEMMRDEFGEDFLKLDMPNPLYDLYKFNVVASDIHNDSLKEIEGLIKSESIVSDVYYQDNLVDGIAQNVNKLAWLSLGIGLLLLIVAISLIHNTIRLSIYSNRFLIKNMELVGASWGFISRPYLVSSIWNGLWSALFAIISLVTILIIIKNEFPELSSVSQMSEWIVLFGGLIIVGVIITFTSTYFVVKKYLQMRLDDLY